MSKQFWKWSDAVESDGSKLILEGVISDETWFGDEVSPAEFRAELNQHEGDLTVHINSGGGDVFAGLSIYNALIDYDGKVTVRVDGLAASIASVIAMAGDEIIMSPGAMMMIHKPWTMIMGDVDELDKAKEVLEGINDSIVPIYANRTGLSQEKIVEMLDAETWMTAEQAVEQGFADSLIEAKKKPTFSEAIKNLTSQYAFQMSATENSLKEALKLSEEGEDNVSEPDENKEEANDPTTNEPVGDEAEEEEVTEVVEPETPKNKSTKKEVKMTKVKEEKEVKDTDKQIAQDAVEPKADKPEQPRVEVKANVDPDEVLYTLGKGINAIMKNSGSDLSKANKELHEYDQKHGLSKKRIAKKEIEYDDTDSLYIPELVFEQVEELRDTHGRVASQVTRHTLTTSQSLKIPTMEHSAGFKPVGWNGDKDENTPTFNDVKVEPKPHAFIQVWSDHSEEDAVVNLVNQIMRNVAYNLDRLDDDIVLTFAGGTFEGETYNTSGILEKGISTVSYDDTGNGKGENFFATVLEALGELKDEEAEQATVVLNPSKLYEIAGYRDNDGRLIFPNQANNLNMGLAGVLPVTLSAKVPNDKVIVGNLSRYHFAQKFGLELTRNNLGVVGDTNLYQSDKSALRAVVRRDGNITAAAIAGSFRVIEETS